MRWPFRGEFFQVCESPTAQNPPMAPSRACTAANRPRHASGNRRRVVLDDPLNHRDATARQLRRRVQ